jgi:hypothetical protein
VETGNVPRGESDGFDDITAQGAPCTQEILWRRGQTLRHDRRLVELVGEAGERLVTFGGDCGEDRLDLFEIGPKCAPLVRVRQRTRPSAESSAKRTKLKGKRYLSM